MSSVTEQRDLRTGRAPWAGPRLATRKLVTPLKTDVVVLGAGISGAMVAKAVVDAGLRVAILDRRAPVAGSTAASTALLQFEIDTPLLHMADEIGFEKARRVWTRSYASIRSLSETVTRLGLDCYFRPRTALYLGGPLLGAHDMQAEARLRQRIGLPTTYLSSVDLKRHAVIDRSCALLSHGAADVDPVLLASTMLDSACRAGARLHSPAEAKEVVAMSRGVEVLTDTDVEISARALVFATGYELAKGIPADGHRRTSTWAIATPPQPQRLWPSQDLIWEAASPYLYIRTTDEGRVMIGGEDEDVENDIIRDRLLPEKVAVLQRKAGELLPFIDVTADCAWAGTFGESATSLPSIGTIPGMANCYAVLGYGGNGITYSVIAAQIIRSLISGTSDQDVDLFAFGNR